MKLITFDFEGTLVDFQWNLQEAVEEVEKLLAEKGLREKISGEPHYAAIYNLISENEEKWGYRRGELAFLMGEIYDTFDLDAASRWQPAEGVLETLEQLGNYRRALVSNVGRKGLDMVLDKFGLRGFFSLIITRNDVTFVKPHPEGLLAALHRLGATKEETIHVGDSLSDLFAARRAGVRTAIILGGENKPELIVREKPDLILPNIARLPDAILQLEQ